MKAPDKIYILTLDNGARFVESVKIKDDYDEYIRKDTLLDWLCHIKKQEEGLKQREVDIFYDSRAALLNEIINKINSL